MAALLLAAKETVEHARQAGLSTLAPDALKDIDERYAQIIARGHRQNSPSTQRPAPSAPVPAARSRAPKPPTCCAASTNTATKRCASPPTYASRLTTTRPNATSA